MVHDGCHAALVLFARAVDIEVAETDAIELLMQSQKSGNEQKFILSPEQQKEMENYQKTVADANKELKKVRKELAKETDALQFWTKVANIGVMPALVALTGIVLAIVKHKRTAAK